MQHLNLHPATRPESARALCIIPKLRVIECMAIVVAAAMLGGCASFNSVTSEVTTFGTWPAGRIGDTYAFERLPSQRDNIERQTQIEDAARPAIETAGFVPVAEGQTADVSIQLAARVDASERSPFDDPFWWHGGLYGPRYGMGWSGGVGIGVGRGFGYGYGGVYENRTYQREVAVLIRDRKTGEPLYEARASNDGVTPSIGTYLGAMFDAAMDNFPNASGGKPRKVTAPIR